jgi:hypothetical protein
MLCLLALVAGFAVALTAAAPARAGEREPKRIDVHELNWDGGFYRCEYNRRTGSRDLRQLPPDRQAVAPGDHAARAAGVLTAVPAGPPHGEPSGP